MGKLPPLGHGEVERPLGRREVATTNWPRRKKPLAGPLRGLRADHASNQTGQSFAVAELGNEPHFRKATLTKVEITVRHPLLYTKGGSGRTYFGIELTFSQGKKPDANPAFATRLGAHTAECC